MDNIIIKVPGKCILFGEHSVVYGYPAIAIAISIYSYCIIEKIKETKIILILSNYDEILSFANTNDLILKIPSQFKQFGECLRIFQEEFNIAFTNIKITINSSLFPSSGLGSSASVAVALVAAINYYFQINLKKDEISKIAFRLEEIIHGTPSGIDNTICTHGNLIYYKKGEFRKLVVPNTIKFLVSYTNMKHNTKKAIESVKNFKIENPKLSQKTLHEMGEITNKAEKELLNGNLNSIGQLMNENQKRLETLGVSNDIIALINNINLENGAFGSKLTGAGCGGCVIAIGTEPILKKISSLLQAKNYKSFITDVDIEGVRIESR